MLRAIKRRHIDLHDLCGRVEKRVRSCREILQARTNTDDQARLRDEFIGCAGARDTNRADGGGMIPWQCAFARLCFRKPEFRLPARNRTIRFPAPGVEDAATRNDDGRIGLADRSDQVRDFLQIGWLPANAPCFRVEQPRRITRTPRSVCPDRRPESRDRSLPGR